MPDDLNSIVNSFGNKIVTDIRNSLRESGVVSGGGQDSKLAAKTRFEIKFLPGGFEIDIYMPDYYFWVNDGRRPGPVSRDGRKSISNWVKSRGIVGKFITDNLKDRVAAQDAIRGKTKRKLKTLKKLPFDKGVKALTYLVSRKITKKGYEATHFLDKVLNDGRVDRFKEQVTEVTKKQIQIEIRK